MSPAASTSPLLVSRTATTTPPYDRAVSDEAKPFDEPATDVLLRTISDTAVDLANVGARDVVLGLMMRDTTAAVVVRALQCVLVPSRSSSSSRP